MVGVGLMGGQAQAATKYSIVKEHWSTETTYLRAVKPKKSVAIWNKKHTKKYYNLNKVPNRTWKSTATLTLKHNGKNTKYVYITGQKADGKASVSGYVWHGYLEQGVGLDMIKGQFAPLMMFTSNKDYLQYIQKSPAQEITREIVALFPNSKVTLNLTRVSIAKGSYYQNDWGYKPGVTGASQLANNYTAIKTFPKITKYLDQSYTKSTATRIAKVKSLLAANGYDAAKRKSLKNYEIGINIFDHTNGNAKYNNGRGYAFVIAQPKGE
jgi:hypothetical protein